MTDDPITANALRRSLTMSDGTPLSCLTQGAGPPVLLLHGFFSAAREWWKTGVAPTLATDRAVIAPDLRGHGQSGKPETPGSYGRRMLRDIVELLDHDGQDALDVIGFSMGAELGLALAVHHPERVRSLTLAGSGWSPEGIENEYRKWFDLLAGRAENPAALRALIEDVPEVTNLPADAITALPMPLHGIIGELDDERPYMERIREVRPEFQPLILPGLDHLGTWRSPEFPGLLRHALAGTL